MLSFTKMHNCYSIDIPASDPLADPNAQNVAPAAPAIEAGQLCQIEDVTNAMKELHSRKCQKTSNIDSVTEDEMAHSVARLAAVTSEYAAGVGAPAWATQMEARMHARFDTMDARFDTVDARLYTTEIQMAHERLETAQLRNNRRISTSADAPLVPLIKVIAGLGPPTIGQVATNPPLAPAPVGTTYPGDLSPGSIRELEGMTLNQISVLAEWAHDNFGIVNEDLIRDRRAKLRGHYTILE
uniref:Uncharacterized protein n=1 Tax=Attheya septentrionalis TaxID=420275 RepID=A0A7S2U4Q7_9STRA